MARKPSNHGKDWSHLDEARLRALACQGVPTPEIARRLQRTVPAIYAHASDIHVSLMPRDK